MVDKEPAVPASKGINEYNSRTVYTRETLDYDRVRKEWEKTRHHLIDLLHQLPDEKITRSFTLPWGRVGKISYLVKLFAEHEEEHAAEIRDWLTNPDHHK